MENHKIAFPKLLISTGILYLTFFTVLLYEVSQLRNRTNIDDMMLIVVLYYTFLVFPVDLTLNSSTVKLRYFLLRIPLVSVAAILLLYCIGFYSVGISLNLDTLSTMMREVRVTRINIAFTGNISFRLLIMTMAVSAVIGFFLYLIQVIVEWQWLKLRHLLFHVLATTIIAVILYSITFFLFSNRFAVSFTDKLIYFLAGMISIVIHRFFYRRIYSDKSL